MALVVVLVAATPAPASGRGAAGGSVDSFLAHLPPSAAQSAITLGSSADRLRAAIQGGALAPVLQQLMVEADAAPDDVRLPAPAVGQASLVSLPATTREAVAGLHAAVTGAADLLGALPAHEVLRVGQDALDSLTQWPIEQRRRGGDLAATGRYAARSPLNLRAELPPGVARAVERGPRAALLIAAALDAYGPLLQTTPRTSTGSVQPVVNGCDVLDLEPQLCVASEAANVHVRNYQLTIDLGGDDVYTSTAGGAPFRIDADTFAPVSVVVDVSGDDRYTPTPLVGYTTLQRAVNDTNRELCAQNLGLCGVDMDETIPILVGSGGGVFGGVGVLVDQAGDDIHATTAPGPREGVPTHAALSVSQGTGFAGIGVLSDAGGDDDYSATAGEAPAVVAVSAQGGGSSGPCTAAVFEDSIGQTEGLGWTCRESCVGGVLLDLGAGDDSYRVDAGVAQGPPIEVRDDELGAQYTAPLRVANGQASAPSLATALLFDAGGGQQGHDAFTLSASAAGPDHPGDPRARGFAIVMGQAASMAGDAWLLTGDGDTTYEATLSAVGRSGSQTLLAQAGELCCGNGSAVLDDVNGNDRYLIRNMLEMDYRLDGAGCCRGRSWVTGPPSQVVGQGGGFQGQALLKDAAGDDTYDVDHRGRVSVTMDGAAYDGAALTVYNWLRMVVAQGSGSTQGVGILLDGTGRDAYRLGVDGVTAAQAVPLAGVTPQTTALDAASAYRVQGQGSAYAVGGVGALVDAGGQRDTFAAQVLTETTTLPDPDGAFVTMPAPQLQGGAVGAGSATFVAVGEQASVWSSPNWPDACPDSAPGDAGSPRGNGGGGLWTGCGSGAGIGTAPRVIDARPAQLQLEVAPAHRDHHEAPDPAVERVRAQATLTDASGAPMVGEVVHFFLAYGRQGDNYVRGITDHAGVATARVPLLGTAHWVEEESNPLQPQLGVVAVFDGVQPSEAAGAVAPAYAYQQLVFAGGAAR